MNFPEHPLQFTCG